MLKKVFWASLTFSLTSPFLGGGNRMTEDRKIEGAAVATEPECLVHIVRSGTTKLRIGLHFSDQKKESADDIFHRLIIEKVKKE